MNGFAIAGLIFVALPCFIIGSWVILTRGKNRVNQLWSAFMFAVSLWGFGMYKIGTATNLVNSIFWWRIAEVGVIFIPVLLTHFVVSFLKLKRRWLLIVFCKTVKLFPVTYEIYGFTKDSWFKNDVGKEKVMSEWNKIPRYLAKGDIEEL